jgi:hypothetical protein
MDPDTAFNIYFEQWIQATTRNGRSLDYSRGDYAVASRMSKEGYTIYEVYKSLLHCSPNIEDRKPNHIDDYAYRTVSKVFGYKD